MKKGIRKKIVVMLLGICLLAPNLSTTVKAQDEVIKLIDSTNFKAQNEMIAFGQSLLLDKKMEVLFDSQANVPAIFGEEMTKAKDTELWQSHYTDDWGITSGLVDLGAYYRIDGLGFSDMNASPTIKFQYGDPGQWRDIATVRADLYNKWREIKLDTPVETRYIRVEVETSQTSISELALYGEKTRDLSSDEILSKNIGTSYEDNLDVGHIIGVNAFVDDPFDATSALGNIREYHNLKFTSHNLTGEMYFSPSENLAWDFDEYYKKAKDMNIDVIPCLQGNLDWMNNGKPYANVSIKPIADGDDPEDPLSYAKHANILYNFVARYGSNSDVDVNTLNLASGQKVKVGLDYVKTVENSNETNKTWEKRSGYFSPYEYAAMCSADYDGHEGRIPYAGVKVADPNMRLAMAGTVGVDLQYLDLMKIWFEHNRDDKLFAVDVINFHYYLDENIPEKDTFKEDIQSVLDWRDNNAPGRDVWLSEFDVLVDDMKVEGLKDTENTELLAVKGERLARAYLLALSTDIDRLSMFMLRDVWEGIYETTGLTTGKGEWHKKPSWYHINTMKETLDNKDFSEIIIESDDLYVYKFSDRNTSEIVYAVWSPEGKKDYTINLAGYDKAVLVKPVDEMVSGERQAIDMSKGEYTVNSTTCPVYIKLSNGDVDDEGYQLEKEVTAIKVSKYFGQTSMSIFDNYEIR